MDFCLEVKSIYPIWFENAMVLDVGSLDINGNNRYLFKNCIYVGVDCKEGKNVDIVCLIHELPKFINTGLNFDTIISTETLEHDPYFGRSIFTMLQLLKPGGLLIITTASKSRVPHNSNGCIRGEKGYDPGEYYQGMSIEMLERLLNPNKSFSCFQFYGNMKSCDTYFCGLKK
jgi:SAM-dependent methyltransferase